MLHRRLTKRATLTLLTLPALSLILALVVARPSIASTAIIEQHWELLQSPWPAGGITSSYSVDLAKGSIPGGTSKFDPQPTVTFEVVGRTTGGLGNGKWEATLYGAGSYENPIATVSFGASDSSFAIKSASFAWPATDTPLTGVRFTPVNNAAPDVAGALTVTKAYLKIHQDGTIKKTVGRYPLAASQSVDSVAFAWVADPVIYQHDGAAFDPAPTVKLRVGGFVWDAPSESFEVRLTEANGTEVPGSRFTVADVGSVESGPLSLTDGVQYRLQVRRLAGATSSGIIDSAELVFEQSTTDVAGLRRTVGWYPTVDAPTDVVSADPLEARFNAPTASVFDVTNNWFTTLKATGADTSASMHLADRNDNNNVFIYGGAHGAGTYSLKKTTTWTALPIAGHDLDLKNVASPPDTLRISGGVLRLDLELRDSTPPGIALFRAEPTPFSPNADGTKDTTTLSASLTDPSAPITWTIEVKNGVGTTVRSYTGIGSSVSQSWDGKDTLGAVVPDGVYTAVLSATDGAGNTATRSISLTVDTVAPTISGYAASRSAFNPNNTTTTFSATVSESSSWTLTIANSGGTTVRSYSGTGTSVSQSWDGKYASGALVSDGTYTATLRAPDAAGNTQAPQLSVRVDTMAPVISGLAAAPNPFSPNNDGTRDITTFAASISDAASTPSWTLTITNGPGTTIRTYSGSGSSVSQSWDGKNGSGLVQPSENHYATLTATDDAGNSAFTWTGAMIDLNAPTISNYAVNWSAFSPNGDAQQDTQTFTATLADSSAPLTWRLDLKNAGGTVVRTYTGSGTSVSQTWDGKDGTGLVVPDGAYTALLTATDAQNLSTPATKSVTVDTVFPVISGYTVAPNPFSPNGDGTADTTTFSASFSETVSWSVYINNSAGGNVAMLHLDNATSFSESWDGRGGNGAYVTDGTYTGLLEVLDPAGNRTTATTTVNVDRSPPVITNYSASPNPFSPNGDGTKDTTTFAGTISDASTPITWRLEIKNIASVVLRTYTGSGGAVSQTWDGKDGTGTTVINGTYYGVLTGTDAVGNKSNSVTPVTVDNTPPTLTPLAPIDLGNADVSLTAGQPIVATIADPLSGVDSSSVRVTLSDNGSSAVEIPASMSAGIVRSTPQHLEAGHAYIATIRADDRAGNASLATVRFNAIEVQAPNVTAKIPNTDASSSTQNLTSTTFTFTKIPLNLSKYSVTVQGQPAHPGFGYIAQTVDLTRAVVHLYSSTAAGEVEMPGSPFPAPPAWSSRTTFAQIVTTDTGVGAQQITVLPTYWEIPNLTFTSSLPGISRAMVVLETTATPTISVCPDPTGTCSSIRFATPDPFPFYLSDQEASIINETWAGIKDTHAEYFLVAANLPRCPTPVGADPCVVPKMSNYVPGLIYPAKWDAVEHLWLKVAPLAPDYQELWLGIHLLYDYPLQLPSSFNSACQTLPCNAAIAKFHGSFASQRVNGETGASSRYCIDADSNVSNENCYQYVDVWIEEDNPGLRGDDECFNVLQLQRDYDTICKDPRFHMWRGGMIATSGFNDAETDEFLIGSDTGKQDTGRPENANTNPQVFGYREPFLGERSYNVDHLYANICAPKLDRGFDDSSRVQFGGAPTHSYFGYPSAPQWTKLYVSPCAGNAFTVDRLHAITLEGVAFSDFYYGGNQSKLTAVYGHRKTTDRWVWGCGPALSYPGFVGCGWSLETEQTKAWQLEAVTTFQW